MKKFIGKDEATSLLTGLGEEFVIVKNPVYVHPEFELYPLAPKLTGFIPGIKGIVMDMDGTTTTTEELCLHSLEYMVRRVSGKYDKNVWHGLDHVRDFPNVIGNSTTKHIEYLIKTYHDIIIPELVFKSFIRTAKWTIQRGEDKSRKEEVESDLKAFGLYNEFCSRILPVESEDIFDDSAASHEVDLFYSDLGGNTDFSEFKNVVRAAITIYYQRYHYILKLINENRIEGRKEEFVVDPGKELIEPMNGTAFFLAMVKGLLPAKSDEITRNFIKKYYPDLNDIRLDEAAEKAENLIKYFRENPVKVAVVTSSIRYEAEIVLREVFRHIHREVSGWECTESEKNKLNESFGSFSNYYDAVITASDSSEIRLKPHRDLYSIALHRIDIPKKDFDKVIGFEDSESGTIAIRAAGIGCCVAVPFAQTSGHDLNAASYIAKGGLPEVVVEKSLFLNS